MNRKVKFLNQQYYFIILLAKETRLLLQEKLLEIIPITIGSMMKTWTYITNNHKLIPLHNEVLLSSFPKWSLRLRRLQKLTKKVETLNLMSKIGNGYFPEEILSVTNIMVIFIGVHSCTVAYWSLWCFRNSFGSQALN